MGVELLVTIGHAGIYLVGHHTVFAPNVGNVLGSATFSKVDRAIHADVLDGLVIVAVVNHEALAQVNLLAGEAQDLILKEGVGRVAPARTGLVLVLDGSVLDNLGVGEFETGAVGNDNFVVGHDVNSDDRGKHC